MSRTKWIWAVLFTVVSMAARADVEDELRAELVGRYALSRGALVSECTDHFTDMKVVGGRLSGGAGARFEAGELVKIDNVNVGAISGLDVNLTLVEPFLLSFQDGPFTLYDQRRCRVQLNFGAGAKARSSDSWSSCEAMLNATFYVSGSGGKSKRGWSDGQLVAWATQLAHALQGCYLQGGK